ncbi:hypothetical protein HYS31_07135 [Candidatus Woesearchaeota archaeon]|nr:hypothetical protein [Candidatus Woesearchaeota archaeon]
MYLAVFDQYGNCQIYTTERPNKKFEIKDIKYAGIRPIYEINVEDIGRKAILIRHLFSEAILSKELNLKRLEDLIIHSG